MMKRIVLSVPLVLLLLLPTIRAASGAPSRHPQAGSSTVVVRVDRSHPIGVSSMETGVTHTQHSVDPWGNPAAVARGRAMIEDASTFQNQFIYGWGTVNPEPSPGHFDWSTLDDRIKLMRSMHAQIVLTLCCAPDWMTSIGRNSSTYSNLAPTPAHYRDFAELARRIALRYPDVRYFQVWSELRGFFVQSILNWDAAAYTSFYNDVYDALKGVDPRIQVGGPYIMIEGSGTHLGNWSQLDPPLPRNMAFLEYWLAHKHGADFIDLKRNAKGDHDPLTYPTPHVMRFTAQFGEIVRTLRALTNLPIWWSENFFGGGGWNLQAAGLASIMYHELLAGSRVSMMWAPQGTQGSRYNGNYQNLFSDTRFAGGGRAFPFYGAFRAFHLYFGPGTRIYRTTSSAPDVLVLASADHVMIINQRGSAITVHVSGLVFHMHQYGVRVLSG